MQSGKRKQSFSSFSSSLTFELFLAFDSASSFYTPMVRNSSLDTYLSRIHQTPRYLTKVERACKQAGIPSITKDVGWLLSILIKLLKAKSVLEIGTGGGYSTLWMARSMPSSGKVVTIESDEKCTSLAKSNFAQSKYSRKIRMIKGDAVKEIPRLKTRFDFVFIDGKKSQYLDYFRKAAKKLRIGGAIVCDDLLLQGAIKNSQLIKEKFKQELNTQNLATALKAKELAKNLRSFNRYILNHPNFETVILSIGEGTGVSVKIK